MSAINGREVESTASRVDKIIADAPPVRTEAEQVQNQLRERMRAVIRGMEQARERLGNFCVTVGNPDDPYGYGVILATPIEDPYSQEYIDQHTTMYGEPVKSGSTDATTSHIYVLITPNGFYMHDFHLAKYHAFTSTRTRTPRQITGDIDRMVAEVGRSPTATAKVDPSLVTISGNRLTIKPAGFRADWCLLFNFYPADQATVERALQASINKAQASFAKSTDRSKLALQTAATVAQQIGMETPSAPISSETPAPKKRFGLF